MIINQILEAERTFCQAPGSSKKKALETVADKLEESVPGIDGEAIFERLITREKLGSTAIGKGVAIPHCRCENISSTIGCLVKLKEPVDFDAQDDLPVDILFVMLVPEEATDEHLQILARLAELLDNPEFRNRLRKSQSDEELFLAATRFEKAA